MALQHLKEASEQMRKQADRYRRSVEYQEGDMVLLSTKNIRFKRCPTKLQRRYVGPFRISQKISAVAYRLQLPDHWTIHPVFHVSLLKQWRESAWSCPVEEEPEMDVELEPEDGYEVERILKWRRAKMGRRMTREFLVTWRDYPLDEAQWIPESNFHDPAQMRDHIRRDHPIEDVGSSSR